MGKADHQLPISTAGDFATAAGASSPRYRDISSACAISDFFRLKCVLVLLLGAAVFLSAAFWLPPLSDLTDPDNPDPRFRGHDIVACFKLEKSKSFLQENIDQLKSDIFDEMQAPNAKVVIITLDEYPRSNLTDVVFGVDPDRNDLQISSASQSLIRSCFGSLVSRQSFLRLTTPLFGDPYFFEVLKFSGGISVAPFNQKAFLLQKSQVSFNFTLNFSIYQVQENFPELTSQLKSGLQLGSHENLYITLTNRRGSTLAPPVTVQAAVVLAVGFGTYTPRIKQLAQTITGPHSRNLGLNHTVFGKVKQVSLSSTLEYSLNGGSVDFLAPAPAPEPPVQHYHDTDPSLSIAPSSVHVRGLPQAQTSAPMKKTTKTCLSSSCHTKKVWPPHLLAAPASASASGITFAHIAQRTSN